MNDDLLKDAEDTAATLARSEIRLKALLFDIIRLPIDQIRVPESDDHAAGVHELKEKLAELKNELNNQRDNLQFASEAEKGLWERKPRPQY